MKPVSYSVTRIGDAWSVRCSHELGVSSSHGSRGAALLAAEQGALVMWKDHGAACRVLISDDDGRWLPVAEFGQMLG